MNPIRNTFAATSLLFLCGSLSAAEIYPAATPNDGLDDTAAIQAAIDSAADGDTIVLGAGQYDLINAAGDSTYRAMLTIVDRNNLTLRGATDADGNPTTRWRYRYRHGSGVPFRKALHVEGGNNITIQNIFYDAPGVIPAGEIVEIGADYTVIELFPDSLGDTWGELKPTGTYSSPFGYQGAAAWVEGERDVFSRLRTTTITVTLQGANQLRVDDVFTGTGISGGRSAVVGDFACLGAQLVSGVTAQDATFTFDSVTDLLVENLQGRDASPRFILMQGNENVTLRNIILDAAIEGDNRGVAATRDGVIGFHNIGRVEWDGVKIYSFTGDDNAALASKMITLSGSGLTKTVTNWGSHPEDRQRLVGSKVWAMSADYKWPGDDQFALITAVAANASTLTFDRPIPGYFDGCGIAVEKRNPHTMIIRNCEFLIRFRQNSQFDTLFENNVFRESAYIARYVNGNFFNGGPVRGGLEMRGNHIIGNLGFTEFNLPASAPGYHRNMQIHDNFFYNNSLSGNGFSESSLVDNVWIEGNVSVSAGGTSEAATVTISGNRKASAPVDPSSPPAAPTALAASAASPTELVVTWADNASNELFYYLERSVDGGAYEVRSPLPAGATRYSDRALKPDTNYQYRLRAYNDSGFSASIETTTATPPVAIVAPTILTEPQDRVAALDGEVVFSVVASGGALAYQWQKDGIDVGTDSPVLTLTNVQADAVGNYSVVVSNSAGTITSASGNLTLLNSVIPITPLHYECESLAYTTSDTVSSFSDGQASGGSALKLTGNAVNDYIEFTVNVPATASYTVSYIYKSFSSRGIGQLSIDGTDLGDPVNQSGGSAFVTVEAGSVALTAGNHLFRFRLTGTSTSSYDLTYDRITLTPTTPPGEPPVITTQPLSQTRSVGQSVTLTVAATGSGTLSYQWKKAGVNLGTNAPSLTLTNLQPADAGNYTVVVTDSEGVVSSTVAILSIADSYSDWSEGYNWDGADSSPAGDANQDGIANLVAYALDLDPLASIAPEDMPTISVDELTPGGPWVVYTYRKNQAASDVSETVRSSTNLSASWSNLIIDDVNVFQEIADSDPDGDGSSVLVRIRIKHDAVLTPQRFLQLQIEIS